MNPAIGKRLIQVAVVVLIGVASYLAWRALQPEELPAGFAGSNGRIEAVEIDVATKIAGRVEEILVNEGDMVSAGQPLAVMDTAVLEAQMREAEAQLQRARIGIETARNQVAQRRAEVDAARAVVLQREAEMDVAERSLARVEELAATGTATQEALDEARARLQGARAAISAAQAQVAAARAARNLAESQVVAAESQVDAVRATIQRIQADIDDATLRSPRDGRVQYLVAYPGEVLAPGGPVLNLVDLTDVYMTFFLPTEAAGRLATGAEARIVLDAAPQFVFPARISLVADVAQFTPRTVETAEERQKLMFRVRARIAPELLRQHLERVKTGLPGMAYVRIDPGQPWPDDLQIRLPQ